MTIKNLIEKRAASYQAMQDLQRRAFSEDRLMSADENEQWEKHDADFNRLTEEIDRAERMKNYESTLQSEQEAQPKLATRTEEKREDAKKRIGEEYRDAFWSLMRDPINTTLRAKVQQLEKEYRGTNIIKTETGANTYGGYTIPETFISELEKTMKYYGPMLQAARIVPTSIGGTMNWPAVNDTATSANWITEGNAVTVQDLTFTRVQFSDYTLSTLAKLSLQFVQDESVNLVEGELAMMFGDRLGRALNTAFTNGDGSGKPTGFITSASTGESAAATAISRDNIVDLIHSVDIAYRQQPGAALMMNDSTLAYIKKLTVGTADDRPLWVPSMREGEPDRIEGYRYWINNDMAAIGTGNKSVAFGDWSKYIIRQVLTPQMARLNELYMENLVIGFIMWSRYDGKLLNTAAIKVIEHA